MSDQAGSGTVTSDDRLWAALGYLLPIIAIVMLLMDGKKSRPFIKFHAVQAIAFGIVLGVLLMLLSVTVILACIAPFVWLVTLWPAIDSYRGNYTQIPVITNFIKNQGWA
jgi:uncharacterized membrane protein